MTRQDGDTFWHIPECYIRGNNIKYLRIPDEVAMSHDPLITIDMIRDCDTAGDRHGSGGAATKEYATLTTAMDSMPCAPLWILCDVLGR